MSCNSNKLTDPTSSESCGSKAASDLIAKTPQVEDGRKTGIGGSRIRGAETGEEHGVEECGEMSGG